ncbi:hypothetical protein [Deinococcus roseus]|uniref:Ig-like domain-containing protein n=1 Tax=Deinococcus roseus TaxID=392414 RepID=A0ABQ2CVY6_9DEIO|nr:hypothetical protein [Deinococcus roseus]GGJ26141.1 hypothetical protein GCM10008938_10370 [Deinococcus roseus]
MRHVPVHDPAPPPTSATLTPAGGTIEVKGNAGSTLSLQVPAGAVTQNVPLKITPLGSNALRFQVEPAGLRLLKPLTVTFTGTLPGKAHFFWNDGKRLSAVPSTLQGKTLKAELLFLGYPQSAAKQNTVQKNTVQKQADPSVTLDVAPLDCAARIAELELQLAAAATRNDFQASFQLHDELQAVLLNCSQTEVQRLETRACDAYLTALQNAQVTAASNLQILSNLLVPLAATTSHVEALDAPCDVSPTAGVMDQKFNQFLVFLEAEYRKNSFFTDTEDHLDQLKVLFDLQAQCQFMGAEQATCDRFPDQLFPDALDRLRQAAYRTCLDRDNTVVLSRLYQDHFDPVRPVQQGSQSGPYLTHARYTYDDLEKDLAYCTSEVTLQVFDDATTVPIEQPGQQKELNAPSSPGNYTTEAEVTVPFDGSIHLGGTLRVPNCPNGTVSSDELVYRIAGKEVARSGRNGEVFNIDTSPADLLPARNLKTAELSVLLPSYTLVVQREGSACGGLLTSEFPLYRIKVNVLPPTLSVKPQNKTVGTRRNQKFEAFLDTLPTSDVNWQTAGGTITQEGTFSAGTVAGTFEVRATLTDSPDHTATAAVVVREDFSGIYSGTCKDISPAANGSGSSFPCALTVLHDPLQTQADLVGVGIFTGNVSGNRKLSATRSGETVFGNFTFSTFQGNYVKSLNETDPDAARVNLPLNRAAGQVWVGTLNGDLSSSIVASLTVTATGISGKTVAVQTLWNVSGSIAANHTLSFGLATGGGASVSFTGTINPEHTQMSGTWRATSGPSNGKTGTFTLELR